MRSILRISCSTTSLSQSKVFCGFYSSARDMSQAEGEYIPNTFSTYEYTLSNLYAENVIDELVNSFII